MVGSVACVLMCSCKHCEQTSDSRGEGRPVSVGFGGCVGIRIPWQRDARHGQPQDRAQGNKG